MLRQWQNLRLQYKLVISMVLISASLTAAALLIIQLRVQAQISNQISGQERASLAAYKNFQVRSEALANSASALVADVPLLKAALSTDDPLTLEDPLNEIGHMLAPGTVLLVTDAGGRVVGRYPQAMHSTSVAGLFRSYRPGDLRPYWSYENGRLFEFFLHPVYRGIPAQGDWLGTLALGQEMDRALAEQISRLAAGEVVFTVAGRAVVSTLQPAQTAEFTRSRLAANRGMQVGVRLGPEQFAVDSEPLDGAGDAPVLTVLHSLRPAQAFLQALNRLVLLVGLAALLIGAGLVFVIAHAFTRPLSALATGVRALEQGDYSYPLAAAGEDEAGQLTAAFARMRASLDQHQQGLLRAARMEAIGQLAGGVAHDFNNLITVINGFSELMLGKLPDGDPNRRYLQQIMHAGTRAAAVTRQLLVFSRKDGSRARPIDINRVIANLQRMLAMMVGEEVDLILSVDSSLPAVEIDPTHIEQMIMNFAANARDAMPQGGRLVLATSQIEIGSGVAVEGFSDAAAGSYVMLEVSDTGTGMDEATQRRIFEPFYTTKAIGKGTGLGLATIYGIVRQSRGHITVESAVGRGTRFRVLLPRCAENAGAESDASQPGAAPAGSGTILVAEDEMETRAMLRESLQQAGYVVIEAGNGLEALTAAAAAGGPIHLVLTDVMMPKMGGIELVHHLRKLRPEIAVIYTSGYAGNRGDIQQTDCFLEKPFTPNQMLRTVDAMLQARRPAAQAAQ